MSDVNLYVRESSISDLAAIRDQHRDRGMRSLLDIDGVISSFMDDATFRRQFDEFSNYYNLVCRARAGDNNAAEELAGMQFEASAQANNFQIQGGTQEILR